ncbi:hypothetical protein ACEWY4_024717 [Coilia grayii]|uniref:HAUS augmin-like complex subunit 6 N-terminal domain-containing protein n=1 Tax=Coilia grayii TaxID=363190 RepID=A0ABD1IVI0_9TELE
MSSDEKQRARYLWGFLLSLGFKADAFTYKRHVVLGETMFDKPNKDAFYIVTHFLLEKLNASRTRDQFRHCYPVLDRKQDAEFRKLTLAWLQEIASECGGSFPKVMASQLLSPSGHKFVHIITSLAKHVMLEEIKTFHTDDSWVPKAVAMPASSSEMAEKRLQVVRSAHLAAAMAQDRFTQEYQARVRSWEKSVQLLMAEKVKYEDLLESQESSTALEEGQLQEKVQKVRCLWAEVEGVHGALKHQQSIMDRVLRGDVDKYALDGATLKVKVPAALQHRLEKRAEQASRGSQCDSAQPSLLQLLELFNEALALLNEERARAMGPTAQLRAGAQSGGPTVQVDGEVLQRLMTRIAQAKEDLKTLWTRMSTQDIPQTWHAIREAEAEWDRKWRELLSDPVLTSVMRANPGVELFPAMSALSCEPTPEDQLKSNSLFLPPALLTEPETENLQQTESAKVETVKPTEDKYSSICPAEQICDEELEPAKTPMMPCVVESLRPRTPVHLAPTKLAQPSPAASVLKDKKDKKAKPAKAEAQASMSTDAEEQPKVPAAKKKEADILNLELENLAEQFAQAVTTSPKDASDEGMDLEHLLSSMIQPLSTRRQLPRTPEHLITDVRTSWKKAVEDSVTQKVRPSGKFPDSFTGLFTPFSEAGGTSVNPDASSLNTTDAPVSTTVPLDTSESFSLQPPTTPAPRNPALNQQRAAVPLTMSFNSSSHIEPLANQCSYEGFKFSIANETPPELSSSDSLLGNDSLFSPSSSREATEDIPEEEEEEEEAELVLTQVTSPPVGGDGKVSSALLYARQRLLAMREKASFLGAVDQDLLSFSPGPSTPGQGGRGQELGDWDSQQRVFSLDLEQLESPSPHRHGDLRLPNLLTFSPIDQL